MTFLAPSADPAVVQQSNQAVSLVDVARRFIVACDDDAQKATEFLASISSTQKAIEADFEKLKKPVREAGQAIDAFFRRPREALDEARKIVNLSLSTYRTQQRIAAEKRQRDLEEEQRKQREAAEAARIAAEHAALEASAIAATVDDDDFNGQIEAELRREAAERSAREAAAQAAIISTAPAPVVEAPKKTTQTASGSVSFRKTWKAVIENPGIVPREYCDPVQSKINAAVKLGAREIPGVRIFEEESASVRTN